MRFSVFPILKSMSLLFSITSCFVALPCVAQEPRECEVDNGPPLSRPVLLQQSWSQPSGGDQREHGSQVWPIYQNPSSEHLAPAMSKSIRAPFARIPDVGNVVVDVDPTYPQNQQSEFATDMFGLPDITEGAARISKLERDLEQMRTIDMLGVDSQRLPLALYTLGRRAGKSQYEFVPQQRRFQALQIARAALNDTSDRPGEGGDADTIEFGIFAKTFYDIDMRSSSFTMDCVLTLRWRDPRVVALVPPGHQSKTLSDQESKSKLWLPEIEITNRAIHSYEIISTSVAISTKGIVTKVERSLAVIKHHFVVDAFPFDTQDLTVKIASSKYMLNELKLAPMDEDDVTGVREGLFNNAGFSLLSVEANSFDDGDGTLEKSRGYVTISIKRDLDKYLQSHLVPSALHLTISWGVFWLPHIPQFITPRVALSVLSLLSFTTLSLKIDNQLPPGAPFTWNDLYNQNCQWLLFFTVVLNIFCEIVTHQADLADVGKLMNNECKLLWPLMAAISLGYVFTATGGANTELARMAPTGGASDLRTRSRLIEGILLVIIALYVARSALRIRKALKAAEQ